MRNWFFYIPRMYGIYVERFLLAALAMEKGRADWAKESGPFVDLFSHPRASKIGSRHTVGHVLPSIDRFRGQLYSGRLRVWRLVIMTSQGYPGPFLPRKVHHLIDLQTKDSKQGDVSMRPKVTCSNSASLVKRREE